MLSSFLQNLPALAGWDRSQYQQHLLHLGLDTDITLDKIELISIDHFAQLLTLAQQPDIGLTLARSQNLLAHGPLSALFLPQRPLGANLSAYVSEFSWLIQGVTLTMQDRGLYLDISFHLDAGVVTQQPQLHDFILASAMRVFEQLLGRRYPFRALYYPDRCSNFSSSSAYFQCPISETSGRLGIAINKSILIEKSTEQLPLLSQRWGFIWAQTEPYLLRLMQQVTLAIFCERATLPQLAELRGQSTRTLQRQLQQRNISLRTLSNNVKAQLARQLLQHTSLSINTIATQLGYRHQSGLTRLVQQQWQASPKQIRAKQITSPEAKNTANAVFY